MKVSFWCYFIVVISVLSVFGGCQIRQHWHEENYIVEGSGYFPIAKDPVKETKAYFVCGEKIRLGVYPQHTIITHKPTYSYKKTGPYKIRVLFSPGYNGERKKILIHDVKISSNLENRYDIIEPERFPITVVPEPYYYTQDIKTLKEKNPNYKISYNFLFDKALDFKFSEHEILYVSFDVEVILNAISKRDTVELKLIPILDTGAKLRMPGDGVQSLDLAQKTYTKFIKTDRYRAALDSEIDRTA